MVCNGENGIVIPPRDVDALEAALRRLITDLPFRHNAGVKSRKIAEERFSVTFFLDTYLGIYDALLGDTTSARAILR